MANQLSLFNTIYTLDCIAQHQHQRGLSGTPSAPTALAANGCLDQHQLMPCVSGLTQHLHRWGLGAPRCLEQSRYMLVLLGAPVSHTISTNEALVLSDAWTSIGSCLVMIGAPGWDNIRINGAVVLGAPFSHTIKALVRGDASTNFGSCPMLMGHFVRKASATVGPW